MTEENNTTQEGIKLTVKGVEYVVNPEIMAHGLELALENLQAQKKAADKYKAEVQDLAEKTGLPKGFLNYFIKGRFKEQLEADKEKADATAKLDEALQ
jgi:hypothetical protein